MEAPAIRYVVGERGSIAYQRWGKGSRRIVAIGPAVGNLDLSWTDPALYDSFMRAADQEDCVMYDQLGQGLSDPVAHVPTLEERAADLGGVMDACDFKALTIFAIFHACLGALVFAAQHPERVDGLVLWNPFVQGWRSAAFDDLVGWAGPEQLAAYELAWERVHDRWGTGESLRMQMPSLATRSNVRLWGLLERAAGSPGIVRAIHAATFAADVRDVLPLVQAPVLALRSQGHTLPEGVMRQVAELLPNATFDQLPATGSMAEFFAAYEQRAEKFMFGAVQEQSALRSLRTVLFTDIVGSTEHALRVGDSVWRGILSEHTRLVRGEVDAAGGRLIDMIGDGSLSTFEGPAQAIRCAERIIAGAGEIDVEIRAGLHTGECELLADGIAGVTVHIAARVSGHAGGGQVLVSRTVKDLVTGSGIVLRPCGEHELKGIPGRWELFAVGEQTEPLLPPDQNRRFRIGDRMVLTAARHAPGVLRAGGRLRNLRAGQN